MFIALRIDGPDEFFIQIRESEGLGNQTTVSVERIRGIYSEEENNDYFQTPGEPFK